MKVNIHHHFAFTTPVATSVNELFAQKMDLFCSITIVQHIARTQNYYPLLEVHIFNLIITISHILDLQYFQEISVSSMTTCVVH